jgi:MFS transporter, AAHS family, 4-hydroxybenzoate transporter
MLVATGLSAGGVLGGLTGGLLLERFGWRSVFLAGGALPLLLLPLIALRIANVKPVSTAAAPGGLLVGALFQGRLAVRTTLLWLFSLLVFTGNYAMAFWLPTMLIGYGLPTGQATTAAAAYAAGGLVGGLALVAVAARLGIERTLLVAVAFAILCLGVLGLVGMTPAMALPVVIGVGAGIAPCCIGQSALAVSAYPPMLRTTGIGWAAASGRVGSIMGPGVGGLLISAGVASDRIFLCAMAPVMAGGIALLLLRHVQGGRVNPGR